VIIPTFNRAKHVARAVTSALGQTGILEIIVIDDGSTDETEGALAQFGGRIAYVRQGHLGVVAARNHGLTLARGALIAFLDSDDVWFPGKLALQLRCFDLRPEMVLNCTNAISVSDEGKRLSDNFLEAYPGYRHLNAQRSAGIERLTVRSDGSPAAILKVGDMSSAMFMGNFVLTPTVLCRADAARETGMFDPGMGQAGEDYDFFWRMSERGPIGLLDYATTCVRRAGNDHLAAAGDRMAVSNLRAIRKYLDRHPAGPNLDRRLVRRRMRESYAWIGLTQFDVGNISLARKYLWKAIWSGSAGSRILSYFVLSLLPTGLGSALRDICRRIRTLKIKGLKSIPLNI